MQQRDWPAEVKVVGPLDWEPPYPPVEPPPGEDPLVLVAPSTAQDPDQMLFRAAVEGLGGERVRVLATWNRRPLPGPARVAANTRLVEWLSYSQTMPECALVICHAGHGTMVRALACGCPVVAVPHCGDMAENAARADWAGVGVRLPWRFLTPGALRLAVRRALTPSGTSFAERARETVGWLMREMRVDEAFAASLDADQDGEEGQFYVWRADEIDAELGDASPRFKAAYDVTEGGNWEGKTVLRRVTPRGGPEQEADLAALRARLFALREARPRPGRARGPRR